MPPKDPLRHNRIKNKSYHKRYATPQGRIGILIADAKRRAKDNELRFDDTIRDELTDIPDTCPLCEGQISLGKETRKDSPSIDRLDPALGYESGNVWMICKHCNTIKNDATLERFERMGRNWRRVVDERTKRVQGANGPRSDMDPGAQPLVRRGGADGD